MTSDTNKGSVHTTHTERILASHQLVPATSVS